MRPSQKSAFLIEYCMQNWVNNKLESHHEYPILILTSVKDAIELLTKYCDVEYSFNNDTLAMKQALKNACFTVELSREAIIRLEKEVLLKDMDSFNEYHREHYNTHGLKITRLPVGIVKKQLFADFY